MVTMQIVSFFFFFNDTATTEIYTLSLHDALPICPRARARTSRPSPTAGPRCSSPRSEEHTSELQSQSNLVCRLLLEKKKKNKINNISVYKEIIPSPERYKLLERSLDALTYIIYT